MLLEVFGLHMIALFTYQKSLCMECVGGPLWIQLTGLLSSGLLMS